MNDSVSPPTYHVLLIGIDSYPPGYNSLSGCVNDIDAIEQLLLDAPGIGIPSEWVRIRRLASSNPHRPSRSRFQAQTLPPTKANLIQALKELAGPEVKPSDRVLIYYSGHGQEQLWQGSPVWHESLVSHEGNKIDHLYDVEINFLINAIAAHKADLTIVLDCCHSAGATRDLAEIVAEGADRYLGGDPAPAEPPDLKALGLPGKGATRALGSSQMLQTLDPDYLVVVACQADEKAGEGRYPGEERSHGIFTSSLLDLLKGVDAEQRAKLRWADIWPALLDRVAARCAKLGRRPQSPWVIGRSERRLFGGSWERQDVGYRVTRLPDGRYAIGAGTLMGLTRDAEIAVYGPTPPLFPTLDSPEDQPVGRLLVVEATRATCTAVPAHTAFDLPQGARGRLVKPGISERLRVALKPDDPNLASKLGQSALLEIVPASTPDADVEVIAEPNGDWTIGNDIEAILARVPAGEIAALRAGLESYYGYHTALQLARNCNDPQLTKGLSLRLLDCSDTVTINAMTEKELADPKLPEVQRDQHGIYSVANGSRSCIKLSNTTSYDLQVTVLNCSAGGLVEYLDKATLRKGASHVMWMAGNLGTGFPASPDPLPVGADGTAPAAFVTDRMIAIGTTRDDVDLGYLRVGQMVQEVVDENLSTRSLEEGDRAMTREAAPAAPVELWTAVTVPVRIKRQ